MAAPDPALRLAQLYHAVYTVLIHTVPEYKQRKFTEFLGGVWARWVATALESGVLPQTTMEPACLNDIIDPDGTDLKYFSERHRATLAPTPRVTRWRWAAHVRVVPAVWSSVQARRMAALAASHGATPEAVALVGRLYGALGFDNNFLALPPAAFQTHPEVWGQYSRIVELFASAPNTLEGACVPTAFCCPFDAERALGGLGSYHTFDYAGDARTLAVCNPPFAQDLMLRAVHKCLALIASHPHLDVLFITPAWDAASFEARRLLESSATSFVVTDKMSFYDYVADSLVPLVPVVVYVLGRTPGLTAGQFVEMWKRVT